MAIRWKVCPVNTCYAVSDRGSIRRKETRIVIKPFVNHGGYLRVRLSQSNKQNNYRVHRLVLLTFVGPAPSRGMEGAHRDGNRRNNRLDNLYWATVEQNTADRVRHYKERSRPPYRTGKNKCT